VLYAFAFAYSVSTVWSFFFAPPYMECFYFFACAVFYVFVFVHLLVDVESDIVNCMYVLLQA